MISTMSLIYVLIIPLSSMTQPNTPRSRIKNQILFLMQIKVHVKLSSVVDKYTSATIQIKFQGTMCFCRFDLFDKLFDLKTAPPPTNLQALQVLFNKISEWLSNLGKFSTTIPPLVELLFLQILVLPPPNISCYQIFQNISIQLSGKHNIIACEIQVIINSVYHKLTCFDLHPSFSVSLLSTIHNHEPPSSQQYTYSSSPSSTSRENLTSRMPDS